MFDILLEDLTRLRTAHFGLLNKVCRNISHSAHLPIRLGELLDSTKGAKKRTMANLGVGKKVYLNVRSCCDCLRAATVFVLQLSSCCNCLRAATVFVQRTARLLEGRSSVVKTAAQHASKASDSWQA
jgi:hypothetical protein